MIVQPFLQEGEDGRGGGGEKRLGRDKIRRLRNSFLGRQQNGVPSVRKEVPLTRGEVRRKVVSAFGPFYKFMWKRFQQNLAHLPALTSQVKLGGLLWGTPHNTMQHSGERSHLMNAAKT